MFIQRINTERLNGCYFPENLLYIKILVVALSAKELVSDGTLLKGKLKWILSSPYSHKKANTKFH